MTGEFRSVNTEWLQALSVVPVEVLGNGYDRDDEHKDGYIARPEGMAGTGGGVVTGDSDDANGAA